MLVTCIWFFIPIRPSLVPTTVGCDAPTAIIAPCINHPDQKTQTTIQSLKTSILSVLASYRGSGGYVDFYIQVETLTVPGGRMASNRSTPNIPRLDSVKVPAN
jgi:hypothetical protein